MSNRVLNIKWRMPVYFLASSVITLLLGLGGWVYLYSQGGVLETNLWILYVVVLLLIGPIFGYFSTRRFQRRLDIIQVAMKQLTQGNLTERIDMRYIGADELDALYVDFNRLASSVEERIKVLRSLGEAQLLQQHPSEEAAVLEERKRLARDLHDTVSQQLFAIHMSASTLSKLLERNPDKAKALIEQLVEMSQHAQKQMRSFIAQLLPLELEGRSLSEALDKWFPDFCTKNRLQGKLDIQLNGRLPETLEQQLFFVVQESMANVVKHAQANQVSLSLTELAHQYRLTVSDDGKGFDVAGIPPRSYGLSTMKERANSLGGTAEILSRVGTGTSIQLHIPKFS